MDRPTLTAEPPVPGQPQPPVVPTPGLEDALVHCAAYGPDARVLLLAHSDAEYRAMRALAASVLPLRGYAMVLARDPAADAWRSPRGATLRVRRCADMGDFHRLAGEHATMVVADPPPEVRPCLSSLLRSARGVPCRVARWAAPPDGR